MPDQAVPPRPMGAVQELARDDVERKRFLKMAGRKIGAGAAATGLAAFIAACGSSGSSSSSASSSTTAAAAAGGPASTSPGQSTTTSHSAMSGDLAIVNYALTLEYLESQFYAKVIKSGLFSGKTLSVLKDFGMDEDEHVAALHQVAMSLGTPAPKPTGKFPLTSAAAVTKLAATVENLGASAYLGQAGNIQSKEILAAALSIHSIEARHAATLNSLLKKSPTPDGAFAKPMTMQQVLAVVKPFIA
jgi:Ferritin-like domain